MPVLACELYRCKITQFTFGIKLTCLYLVGAEGIFELNLLAKDETLAVSSYFVYLL